MLHVETRCNSVYVNSNTATDDSARRFETSEVKLRVAIITVDGKAQLLGTKTGQTYPMKEEGCCMLPQVDISTLYFKNAKAGQNGTVHILAVLDVEEESEE